MILQLDHHRTDGLRSIHRSIIDTMRHGDFFDSAAGFFKVMWGGMNATDKKAACEAKLDITPYASTQAARTLSLMY